jgi:UDP-3-O-[3-hydroxymyristoyl] glucosamine N-acyltransferase
MGRLQAFNCRGSVKKMIHETAIVKSKIPESCTIHPYAIVQENVRLGENCIIHPFVVINDHVQLGDNVEVFPGAYIGKEPKGAGALARQPVFEKKVNIGADCSIGPHAVIYYDVEIGNNTLLGDGASIREQCRIGAQVIIGRYVTINYEVTIGDLTKIMDHSWLAGNMKIGKNVFISGGVMTANDNDMGAGGYDHHVVGPVIQNNSRIGVGAILLPGITVGEHSVIAAGAVATRNVSINKTVKGIPAREV